ncbi:hypothetical protein DOY81_010532 [Sarcophaga bullata]|nr:hypothetical protein DOY81_010532 [Sarcophaga bullata]
MLNAGSLQIKQISGPPCVAIKQSVNGAISTSRVSSMPSTLVQQQVQTPAPMQMQYSLSNQLKVTSVPLSNTSIPAIRPLVATTSQSVVGSTASTLISIRTKAPAPVPTQIVQKVNFMPTLTPGTIQSTVRPIMTSSVQSFTSTTIQQPTVQPVMTVATSRASVIPTSQPTNSFAVPIVFTVPPLPPLSMITNSTTQL